MLSAESLSNRNTPEDSQTDPALSILSIEVTGRCQLECVHCFQDSSPQGMHGTMAAEHDVSLGTWQRVISEFAELSPPLPEGQSRLVQVVGGESTTYPGLESLIDHTLASGMRIEVVSNLYVVGPKLWQAFQRPGVQLAVSFYTGMPGQHDAVTRRLGSYGKTLDNIHEALKRNIPLRAIITRIEAGQDIEGALAVLQSAGLSRDDIYVGPERAVGRAVRSGDEELELCGHCGDGNAALLLNGALAACVFARREQHGNVQGQSLPELLAGLPGLRAALSPYFPSPDTDVTRR